LSVSFFGALFGVLLAFWLDRGHGRRANKRLSGRVLQSCRFELGYLRSYVQSKLKGLTAVKFPLGGLSASLPATRRALVNPLVFEHAPPPLITVLNAVLEYTKINAEALDAFAAFASVKPVVARSDAAQPSRTAFAESLTRLERLIEVAVESLEEELRHLGLVAQPDAADHAMGQRINKILMDPIEEAPPPTT
jgi:hypothetical protein